MKEAMWSVDKVAGVRFSDAGPGESYAFELFEFRPLWDVLLEKFHGQRVLMKDLDRFVIEETDYLPSHARMILRKCERSGDLNIDVVAGYKRRAGTFKYDRVYIKFPSMERKLLFWPASEAGKLDCGGSLATVLRRFSQRRNLPN
jgi:hypothetical protein